MCSSSTSICFISTVVKVGVKLVVVVIVLLLVVVGVK